MSKFADFFDENGQAKKIWNSPWTGVPLWLIAAALTVYWLRHLPNPGYAIGALAVVAGVMSVREMKVLGRIAWVILLIGLVITEFISIRADRKKEEAQQNQFQDEENGRLKQMLDEERADTKQLLDQENKSLSTMLQQDQKEFERTLSTVTTEHSQDENNFESVIESQREFSDRLAGRLVPGSGPTPANRCSTEGKNPPDGGVLVAYGNQSGAIGNKGSTMGILRIGDTQVLSLRPIADSQNVALAVDFRDSQNRVLLQADESGIVNRSADLIVRRPTKSEFLIEDEFGKKFLQVDYVNPSAIKVSGDNCLLWSQSQQSLGQFF